MKFKISNSDFRGNLENFPLLDWSNSTFFGNCVIQIDSLQTFINYYWQKETSAKKKKNDAKSFSLHIWCIFQTCFWIFLSCYPSISAMLFCKSSRHNPVSPPCGLVWVFIGLPTLACSCVQAHQRRHSWACPYFPCISCSFFLDNLRDGRQVAVQLLFCRVLLPLFIRNSTQNFSLVPIQAFLFVSFRFQAVQLFMIVKVLSHINLSGLFNAKSIFIQINSPISNNSL